MKMGPYKNWIGDNWGGGGVIMPYLWWLPTKVMMIGKAYEC